MILDAVGKFIRRQRETHEMKLEEFAFLCGTDLSNISKIELGKKNSTLATIRKIASALNMNLSDLIQNAVDDGPDIVDAFLTEMFPFVKERFRAYDPLLLLDFFGEITLERFTLLDLERAAFGIELGKVYSVTKSCIDDPFLGRYISYGINAEKDGACTVIQDICLEKEEAEKFANRLNCSQAPISQLEYFVEDFESNYMTFINPYALIEG